MLSFGTPSYHMGHELYE